MNGNMAEIDIVLEEIEYAPSAFIRQFYIQCNGCGNVFVCELKYFTEISCDQNFQMFFMRFLHHDLCKTDIIFYKKNHLIAIQNIVSVIANFVDDLIK